MNKQLFEYSYSLRKEKQRQVLFILVYFLILFLSINLIIKYLIFPVRQNSISMSPDIEKNCCVFVTPLDKTPERGDVVLIKPDSLEEKKWWNNLINDFKSFFTAQQISDDENVNYPGQTSSLRRVIGMPGDNIYMRDYIIYVQSKGEKHYLTEFEISDKAYNITFCVAPAGWDKELGAKGNFENITLKDNEYFVLGDYRKSSIDSRVWGAVTSEKIRGKALFCFFPFNKIKHF